MRLRDVWLWLLFAVSCLLLGCAGGGSEGTGLQATYRSVEGRIIAADGSPVSFAQVTILETGESGSTDQDGQFSIQTSGTETSLELEIQKDADSARTTISLSDEDTQGVQVTIRFDPSVGGAIPLQSLEVSVKVVGECDQYFENKRTIRQANAVPAGTRCTVKIITRAKGKPIGNIPFGLRYRGCNGDSRSFELAAGLTSVVYNPGVGQVVFPYIDSAERCVYEISVPYKQPETKPIVYEILTFTKQATALNSNR